MKNLNKEQIKAIVLASISIVLGVLFCIFRLEMLGALETIACMALLIYGVIEVVIYCVVNTENREFITLLKGALATALALLIIFVGAVFVVILGLIIVFSGAIYIVSAVKDKKEKISGWLFGFVIGVFLVLSGLAVAILYNTKIAANIVMTIFGITLLFDGIVRLIYVFLAHKTLYMFVSKDEGEEIKEVEANVQNIENSDVIEHENIVTKEEKDNRKEKTEKKKKEKKLKPEKAEEIVEEDKNIEEENESVEDDDDGVEGFV